MNHLLQWRWWQWDGIDAERAKLKDKTNLRDLSLNWGSDDHDNEMAFDEVLEGLEPNPNLRDSLEVRDFPGSSNCLPNLVEIRIYYCHRCEKLLCLKVLDISGTNSVGEEFYCQLEEEERIISNGSGSAVNTVSLFPSLISLALAYMENLEEWVAPPAIYNSFPSLEKLDIQECPKLRSTPKSFSFLKELFLVFFDKGVTSIFTTGGLTSLTSITIYCYQNLCIPLGVLLQNITPNLQRLHMENCPKFHGFVEDDDLNNYINKDGDDEAVLSFSCPEINSNSNNTSNSLRSLYLDESPVLMLLPDLQSFTSLRELTIYDCDKLKESIPYDLKTLYLP